MDVHSGYNPIQINPLDAPKIAFMMKLGNYYYNVTPLFLKNTASTYQRLMDAIFAHPIGRNLEVYVDDMIVKTIKRRSHVKDLKGVI